MSSLAGASALQTEAAPAKVNLYLHVLGRRADGYHLLDSLVVFAEAADTVALQPAPAGALSLDVEGPFADRLAADPDNLVLQAAARLGEAAGRSDGARLVLRKTLPVASGIGGGSADAAATLRLLARVWGLDPDRLGVPALALSLGADVPVCLAGHAARMSGIGDVRERAPALPEGGLVLVNPGVHVATATVFRARSGPFSPRARLRPRWADIGELVDDLAATRNDLERPAIGLCPAIAEVLTALREVPGCRLARMSGSGATCFGLFDTAGQARNAAAALRRPGWWTHGGRLLG